MQHRDGLALLLRQGRAVRPAFEPGTAAAAAAAAAARYGGGGGGGGAVSLEESATLTKVRLQLGACAAAGGLLALPSSSSSSSSPSSTSSSSSPSSGVPLNWLMYPGLFAGGGLDVMTAYLLGVLLKVLGLGLGLACWACC